MIQRDKLKIAIGGPIASGKSTLAKKLSEYYELPLMEEFEEDDEVFHTLLKWLYEGKPNTEMLLQVYFIHAHWLGQQEFGDHFIVDRDLIEHWLFAQKNLKDFKQVFNMYNGLFHLYMSDIKKPDIYFILDMNWDTFKKRLFTRGRKQEIDNFERNEGYFRDLLSDYVDKLVAQCIIHEIPYKVINVDYSNEDQVLEDVKKEIRALERTRNKIYDPKYIVNSIMRDARKISGKKGIAVVTYKGEEYKVLYTDDQCEIVTNTSPHASVLYRGSYSLDE